MRRRERVARSALDTSATTIGPLFGYIISYTFVARAHEDGLGNWR
jgi:hypothetical protein